jgi:hypothetical protein
MTRLPPRPLTQPAARPDVVPEPERPAGGSDTVAVGLPYSFNGGLGEQVAGLTADG